MSKKTPITVAHGGIGPEIMEACLDISHHDIAHHGTIHPGLKPGMIDGLGTIAWPGRRCDRVLAAGYDMVKTESLRTFDGKPGFTLAQGQ